MSFELAIQKLLHKKYDNSVFLCDITGYCGECCNKGCCLDIDNHIEDSPAYTDGIEYIGHPYFKENPFDNPGFNTWP